jgi:hypothetical protein
LNSVSSRIPGWARDATGAIAFTRSDARLTS